MTGTVGEDGETYPPQRSCIGTVQLRVYRASELGGCIKAQVAKHLGYDPVDAPAEFAVRFAEGNLHEEAVVATLMDMEYGIYDRQELVTIPINENVVLEGHIDGTAETPMYPRRRVLEVKSMSDAEFRKFEDQLWDAPGLIQKYKWQLSCYMIAAKMEALVVAKNRNNGQLKLVGVELPFYSLDEIKARILACEDWVARDQLPEACDTLQYPCPFFYLHTEEEEGTDDTLDYIELGKAAAAFLAAKKTTEIASELEKLAREELLKTLGDRDKVKKEGLSITYYDYTVTSLDKKAMEKAGINLKPYTKETKSKRLRVRLQEDTDAGQADEE